MMTGDSPVLLHLLRCLLAPAVLQRSQPTERRRRAVGMKRGGVRPSGALVVCGTQVHASFQRFHPGSLWFTHVNTGLHTGSDWFKEVHNGLTGLTQV